jgi:serine protease
MRRESSPLALTSALALLVTACGGGGNGGGGGNPPANPVEVAPRFTVAGTVRASDSQAADGDTNDPGSEAIPNDTVAGAQPIPNPVTLGGYVNQPGTGPPGRSHLEGDPNDYFRVELLAGQRVTMLVADFGEADADLYLYDTAGRILDFSVDTGEIESLVIAEDGTYVINAFAFEGGTNYTLAVGGQSAPAGAGAGRHAIVPWQGVVGYRDEGDAGDTAMVAAAGQMAMAQRAGGPGRARLMALQRDLPGGPELASRLGGALGKRSHLQDAALAARWETLTAIKSLRRMPGVAWAEPNYLVRALAVPDDQALPYQWHYPLIDLPAAWEITTGDPAVVVAVVDTGILAGHPDLAGQLLDGYDFVSDPAVAGDGDGVDPDPEDPGSPAGADPGSFHGTHVSGTVAARGDNGLGVTGVAYSARIMPLRALGAGGGGTSYDVGQAIRFAAGLANDSGALPQQRADIINLSLAGGPFSRADQALIDEVRAAGVAVVAAAGNEASSLPAYPAAYDGVIAVSAVDAQRRLAPYSNSGPHIDLAAPGGDNTVDLNGDGYPDGVLSTGGSGAGAEIEFVYSFLSGTSMAAPHVAGVLALMKSVNPALTPEDIDALLVRGELSDDLGPGGRDDAYGHGLINARRAVLAALEAGGGAPAEQPRLVASATALNFGSNRSRLELALANGGAGELELLALDSSVEWLNLTPLATGPDGLGRYRVTIDRRTLTPGTHAGRISARSTVNDLVVRVLVSVPAAGIAADVGVIYVLLYDIASGEPVAQSAVRADDGDYRFRFDGVPAGEYRIVAGTDADNDLSICDAGEACGAWLTLDQPIPLELGADADGIDFPIDYLVAFPGTGSASTERRLPPAAAPRR